MNYKTRSHFVCAVFLSCISSLSANAKVNIVAEGRSTYSIVIPATAPSSVQTAAQEMQRDIELATGAKLPQYKDDVEINTPVISIGSTRQATAAGISSAEMADESFRIVIKNGDLFILGPDTPDGGWTKNDGVSNGSANGVYSFLEEFLGVRWLMPGELGRDVPQRSTLALKTIDRTVTPQFSWRRLTHLWDYSNASQMRSIMQWMEHQKIGGSTNLDYDHNWWRAANDSSWNSDVNTPAIKALYAAHPEWFAMDGTGQRPYPSNHYAKFETTNPELVRWFAKKAVTALKATERPRTFSLSPSDGNRWSQSPESKALYDPSPNNLFDAEAPAGEQSMSSLILKWYHDVAQIVEKDHPQGRLTGYIYASYAYPPVKAEMKLPNNFLPVVATIGGGYLLHDKEYQKRFSYLMDSWAKVAPENWFYYDLPVQMLRQHDDEIGDVNFPGSTGIITPAAPAILDTIFSTLHRDKIKGSYLYGVPSWSNAAMTNYIIAKMEWNPALNAKTLQREWLHRAYGAQAGAAMERFYNKLDAWMNVYYQQPQKSAPYLLTVAVLKEVWATHYPEMEKLLLAAKAKPMTDLQKQRFQLLEDNLIVLQWRLRNAGFLSEKFSSPLQRDDSQINNLLLKENDAFPLFPGADGTPYVNWNAPQPLPWKVKLADSAQPIVAGSTRPTLQDGEFLIYAAQDGDIRITPTRATHGAYFASFQIRDAAGALVKSGILNTATPLVFSAQAGSAYTLYIPSRKAVNYQLRIENTANASGSIQDGTLMLSGKSAPVYVFYVPGSTPVGVMEDGDAVILKKPYSGAAASAIMGEDYVNTRVLHALDEGWKFSTDPQNNGIARGVINDDFDDSQWKSISPLDWWQMQGYPDYHGVAWYRIKFTQEKPLPPSDRARLYFGGVDGNVVVYINGKKLLEHTLSKEDGYKGWDTPFSSDLMEFWRTGENTIAVQVTSKNDTTASGIFKGVAVVAGTRK